MYRPLRQREHLAEKVALKESRARGRKLGSRTKRWRKWLDRYKDVAASAS
jgi:hypothetical protein